jgi:hypothetical protein
MGNHGAYITQQSDRERLVFLLHLCAKQLILLAPRKTRGLILFAAIKRLTARTFLNSSWVRGEQTEINTTRRLHAV